MALRKRFKNKNGKVSGEVVAEVSMLRYRVCLIEDGQLVDEKSGFAPGWSTGNGIQVVTIAGEYFRASVRLTQNDADVRWAWPEGKEAPFGSFREIREWYGF